MIFRLTAVLLLCGVAQDVSGADAPVCACNAAWNDCLAKQRTAELAVFNSCEDECATKQPAAAKAAITCSIAKCRAAQPKLQAYDKCFMEHNHNMQPGCGTVQGVSYERQMDNAKAKEPHKSKGDEAEKAEMDKFMKRLETVFKPSGLFDQGMCVEQCLHKANRPDLSWMAAFDDEHEHMVDNATKLCAKELGSVTPGYLSHLSAATAKSPSAT